MKQNEALVSPNKRFKLILESSGNLVIKDGSRTMWTSLSGSRVFAQPPYELILTPTGNIMVVDANKNIVWSSRTSVHTKYENEFKLSMLDQGKLVVRDKKGEVIWESWPMNNMSTGINFYKPIKYKYTPCHPSNA